MTKHFAKAYQFQHRSNQMQANKHKSLWNSLIQDFNNVLVGGITNRLSFRKFNNEKGVLSQKRTMTIIFASLITSTLFFLFVVYHFSTLSPINIRHKQSDHVVSLSNRISFDSWRAASALDCWSPPLNEE